MMSAFNAIETILNVLAFVSLGIYIGMLTNEHDILKRTLLFMFISLFFETAQYVLAIGASDITDIISNIVGAIFGLAIYIF